MRNINDINIFDRSMSLEDMNDMLLTAPQTDISPYIKSDNRDFLDRGIEEYEANVPLPAQMLAGFTLPGMAIDFAAAGKYGRDATRQFRQGNVGQGFGNLGIAALSGLAAVPLIGELANLAKQPLKKGIASLDKGDANILKKSITQEGADDVVDIANIQRALDPSGNILRSPAARVEDAARQMKSTGKGYEYKGVKQTPRQPIEVLVKADGTLEQLAGKSSIEALERAGISKVPIKKFASREEFLDYEKIRKLNKEKTRIEKSSKLQPQPGNPTFELKVEPFGHKTKKQVKQIFNGHQEDIGTGFVNDDAAFIFERAKRLNPEFQQSIDDVAKQYNKKTAANPGGKQGEIDPETGQLKGQIKGIPRMIEKANDKYNGDISQMTDSIRTRIIVNNPKEEAEIAKAIAAKFSAMDSGRVLKPEGYIDRKLNIQFTGSNGEKIIAEVGLITDEMWQASKKAHPIYEEFRSLVPKGIPTDPKQLAQLSDEVLTKSLALQKEMKRVYSEAGAKIDPDFFDLDIQKFAKGGEVAYPIGKSGKVPPMVPNLSLNSVSDNWTPSNTKSATCAGLADIHESPFIKKPSLPSGTDSTTAGPSSQPKYNVSLFITPSLQKFTKNYNPNDVDIFEVE